MSGTARGVLSRRGWISFLCVGAVAGPLVGVCAAQDDILQVYNPSLTAYLATAAGAGQDSRALVLQRGAGIDGSRRAPVVQGWAASGNPSGEAWNAKRMLGQVDLATGGYVAHDVDL